MRNLQDLKSAFRDLRKEMGFTQGRVAKMLSERTGGVVTQSQVSRFETTRRGRPRSAAALDAIRQLVGEWEPSAPTVARECSTYYAINGEPLDNSSAPPVASEKACVDFWREFGSIRNLSAPELTKIYLIQQAATRAIGSAGFIPPINEGADAPET